MTLKAFIAFLCISFISSYAVGQTSFTNKLTGKWEATDGDGVTGSLNFIDSVHVIVTIPGRSLPTGNYVVDTTKTPMWFDITFRQGNVIETMTGLMKLISDTRLKWQISTTGTRSETFNKEKTDNSIILTRSTSLKK
ncbi:MAG: hypothetical protein QM791_07835 [Ferruginibacter sp.]